MNDGADSAAPAIEDFLASHGGPFYDLQRRLGLLEENALRVRSRLLVFVGLAWGMPLLLSLAGGRALDASAGRPYLMDIGAWAKFFVATAAFILAEQQIEAQLRQKLRQAVAAPVLAPSSIGAAAAAVGDALRWRNSRPAEAVCLAIAVAASLVTLRHNLALGRPSWAIMATPGGNAITLAGWWSLLVSLPLFWFMAARGLWRHLVWSLLLRRVAHMELRLVSTHPDGRGGLGFIAEYPNAYMLFVFGLSTAAAAAIGRNLLDDTASISAISTLMGIWLFLVLGLFALPLSAFSWPLMRLKKASLERLGTQATTYHRSAERKLTGANTLADSRLEAEEARDVPDPTKQFETTRKLSTVLMTRSALLPLSAAALVPFSILAATRVPAKEVLSLVKKLLLL